MLGWALTFLVVALVAALPGITSVARTAFAAAKIVFYVAIALFVISTIIGAVRGRRV